LVKLAILLAKLLELVRRRGLLGIGDGSDDKIVRAGPISEWLWGKWNPRRAYYLAEKTNAYPFFTEASQIAIRKSVPPPRVAGAGARGKGDSGRPIISSWRLASSRFNASIGPT
jgi:hypothetical protein